MGKRFHYKNIKNKMEFERIHFCFLSILIELLELFREKVNIV